MAEFVLQIHDIDEAGKDYRFTLEKEWLNVVLADSGMRADDAAAYGGGLEVHAQKNDADFLVNGTIVANVVTDCVRCLGEAKVPVDVHFASLYCRGSVKEEAPDEIEIDDEDDGLQREAFAGHEIVLDDLVREHIVLECPMQPLCTPDCKGIAVPEHVKPPEEVFGSGKPPSEGGIDPRLAPLMRLRDKVPPKKS